jgi:hypothetical protein
MATVAVVMAEDWQEHLREAEVEFLDGRLGPDMLADAQRAVPVDTGRLLGSLAHQVVDEAGAVPELQVGSFPDAEGPVEYAAAVELGFHGQETVREHTSRSSRGTQFTVREHVRQANTPEQPFLRSSLYRTRY